MRKIRQSGMIILALFAPLIINSLISCKNYDLNTEIRQSDSLISIISKASELMIVENEQIKLRLDSMQKRIKVLNSLDTLRMSTEFRQDILQYKALFRNYSGFTINYEALKYDNSVYLKYANKLKQRLLDQQIGKEDFAVLYLDKRKEADLHYQACRKTIREILGVEKLYQRINTKMIAFLQQHENQ
jgi:hypothetical protein